MNSSAVILTFEMGGGGWVGGGGGWVGGGGGWVGGRRWVGGEGGLA